mmetsp:Transcript_38315/g.96393  ORF Transcript_38315/g.96393 Transcript_38315/m.96393 type:complete len:344 (-) Transcript_38315:81-1112(-)
MVLVQCDAEFVGGLCSLALLHHVDAPVSQVLGQIGIENRIVFVRCVTVHIRTLRGDSTQLHHQRVFAAGLLKVLQCRAGATGTVKVATTATNVARTEVQPQVFTHPTLGTLPVLWSRRNLDPVVQLRQILGILALLGRIILPSEWSKFTSVHTCQQSDNHIANAGRKMLLPLIPGKQSNRVLVTTMKQGHSQFLYTFPAIFLDLKAAFNADGQLGDLGIIDVTFRCGGSDCLHLWNTTNPFPQVKSTRGSGRGRSISKGVGKSKTAVGAKRCKETRTVLGCGEAVSTLVRVHSIAHLRHTHGLYGIADRANGHNELGGVRELPVQVVLASAYHLHAKIGHILN